MKDGTDVLGRSVKASLRAIVRETLLHRGSPEDCLMPLLRDPRSSAHRRCPRHSGRRPHEGDPRSTPGHASNTATLNVFGHVVPALDEQLAERLDGMTSEGSAA
jgi:hypothetical protein